MPRTKPMPPTVTALEGPEDHDTRYDSDTGKLVATGTVITDDGKSDRATLTDTANIATDAT